MDPAAPYHTLVEALVGIVVAGCSYFLYSLRNRVDSLEADFKEYEGCVGAGNQKLEHLSIMLQGHMEREEGRLKEMNDLYRDLLVQLTALVGKLDAVAVVARDSAAHMDAHEKDSEDWKLRIVRLETRMGVVESGKKVSL